MRSHVKTFYLSDKRSKIMTGRELIMWILEKNAEDAEIEVQYRDAGGDYSGTDNVLYLIDETVDSEDGWSSYRRIVL